MIDEITNALLDVVETTKTYKEAGIRVMMITSLTLLIASVTTLFYNFNSVLRFTSNLLNRKEPKTITVRDVLQIESTLNSIKLPRGYIIGIEDIKATGVREIFWLSNEDTFNELKDIDSNFLNRNPRHLQYAKGFAYLVGACNQAPVVRNTYNYNYYVCPIRSNSEVIGIVWILFDVDLSESPDGLNIQAELVPILLEIRDLLEDNGLN